MKKEQKHREYLDAHHICWTEGDGGLHIDAVRACEVMGFEPTQENQDAMVKGIMEGAKVVMPGKPVQVVEHPKERPCDHKFVGSNSCVKCGWSPDFQGGPMGGA